MQPNLLLAHFPLDAHVKPTSSMIKLLRGLDQARKRPDDGYPGPCDDTPDDAPDDAPDDDSAMMLV